MTVSGKPTCFRLRTKAIATMLVAIGLAAGCGSSSEVPNRSLAPGTATNTVTITATVQKTTTSVLTATAAPTTVTVTGGPARSASGGGGSAGPFEDGTYLLGVDIQVGNYRCSTPVGGNNQSTTRWITRDSANNPIDAGGEVASLSASAYLIELENCPNGQWVKIS